MFPTIPCPILPRFVCVHSDFFVKKEEENFNENDNECTQSDQRCQAEDAPAGRL